MQKNKKAVKPVKSAKALAKAPAKNNKKAVAKKNAVVQKAKVVSSYSVGDVVPLFKGKKKKFFDMLMKLRQQILGQVKFLSEEAIESKSSELAGSVSNHMADFGSDNFLHDMELHMLSDDSEIIEMIDEAIERLSSGEYGKCLECGCQIPEARLEVKPYARYCVKCKSLHESNGDLTP